MNDISINTRRALFVVACVIACLLLGGFESLALALRTAEVKHDVVIAWCLAFALFVGGAYVGSLVIHPLGEELFGCLRFLYLVLGLALMSVSVVWLRALLIGLRHLTLQGH